MSNREASGRAAQFFQRSLTAHLPFPVLSKLQNTSVLVAGLGGGSNIAELLVRKGIGRLIIADPDVYEAHNIRQRGHLVSTLGKSKTQVMYERLLDIYPDLAVTPIDTGVTVDNVQELVRHADYIVDMIDFSALEAKVALHRTARAAQKIVLTAPSVINGAVLYVFAPEGITFEEFFMYKEGLPLHELGPRFLQRLIPHYPSEAPAALYQAAARGERTIPLDAVGVEQAAVLTVGAIENLVLGRVDRVVMIPKGLQVDTSDPHYLAQIIDYSAQFARIANAA